MLVRWPVLDAKGEVRTDPAIEMKRRDRNRAVDYFHSSFVDLVLGYLCGVRPQADNSIIVSPLATGAFAVDKLWYHGCVFVSVLYDPNGDAFDVQIPGWSSKDHNGGDRFLVLLDGAVAASAPHARPLRVELPGHCAPGGGSD